MKRIFITGIGTNIGKTVVSAIVTEYLNADYWKPIQSGDLMDSDTMKVKTLISNNKSVFHPEKYRLSQPLSPHAAAKRDGVAIKLEDFILPETENHLVIEGAGGLMVPLNDEILIADLIEQLDVSVLLVSQNYLGSINHTLLTIQELKRRNVKIIGIVINGESSPETEAFIEKYSNLPIILRIANEDSINQNTVLKYAEKLNFDDIL
jgi:dethiobiotin synthetase